MNKAKKIMAIISALAIIGCLSVPVYANSNMDASKANQVSSKVTSKSKHYQKGENRQAQISSLVSSGIIDQTTADAITAYIAQKQADKKALREKISAMTDSEKQAYFESQKGKTKNSLWDELVNAGIITSDQATAIKAALPKTNKKVFKQWDVNTFVSAGIIDQKTADAITAYREKKLEDRKAQKDKLSTMTDSEKQAYFESQKDKSKSSFWDELVSAGIITSDQATAIKKAIQQEKKDAKTSDSVKTSDTVSVI